jgi:HptB-dependent secretion and biofilm anti anti-sigma factor
MKDSISAMDGNLTISLAEKLTFEDHENFRDLLRLISEGDHRSCIVDLSNLHAIDSAGLGMLMIAFETAEKQGLNFSLSKPTGQVERLLEISEFNKVMPIIH